ncbi:MAG TPA: hypothetical protein DCY82_15375, partial [Acidimicrobiaceae bacterium]|nr:hypothetical protein [Acidimicrobiaceae bacterium]
TRRVGNAGDLGSFDPNEDSVALLASLDPALLAATTTALDACVSPVVLVSEAFSSESIERSEHT